MRRRREKELPPHLHVLRKVHVRTQQEERHLQARERDVPEPNRAAPGPQTSSLQDSEKMHLCVQDTQSLIHCYSNLSRLRQTVEEH